MMHLYIPLWLCWTGGVVVVLAAVVSMGIVLEAGLAEGNRDIDRMLSDPYPDPRRTCGV